METNDIISLNLRALREHNRLSLATCAETINELTSLTMNDVKLSRWETGRYQFKVTDLFELAHFYGCTIVYLCVPPDRTVEDMKRLNMFVFEYPSLLHGRTHGK